MSQEGFGFLLSGGVVFFHQNVLGKDERKNEGLQKNRLKGQQEKDRLEMCGEVVVNESIVKVRIRKFSSFEFSQPLSSNETITTN